MSKELSEMCPLGEKMAKIWLKLQENGEKKISNGESDGERKIYPSANPVNSITDFQNMPESINNKEQGIFVFKSDIFIN